MGISFKTSYYQKAMKFAVRFSLSLTLVVLLAMVNAEPKTYMIETRDGDGTGGDTGSKGESLVSLESLVPWKPRKSLEPLTMNRDWPLCRWPEYDCIGDQLCMNTVEDR